MMRTALRVAFRVKTNSKSLSSVFSAALNSGVASMFRVPPQEHRCRTFSLSIFKKKFFHPGRSLLPEGRPYSPPASAAFGGPTPVTLKLVV